MSEQEKQKPKQYHYFVDGNKYETDRAALSGAEIKASANISETYQLFLEEKGDTPDRAISDGESVDLRHDTKHFFAVPPATFGAK